MLVGGELKLHVNKQIKTMIIFNVPLILIILLLLGGNTSTAYFLPRISFPKESPTDMKVFIKYSSFSSNIARLVLGRKLRFTQSLFYKISAPIGVMEA